MNDSDDRLRRADPVAGQPYHHANIGQMISRITTARSSSHERQWRLFKLRMASAVALASALTVGAVSLLAGVGSGLPVLELGAGSAAPPGATSSMMMIWARFQFSPGPNLSADAATGTAYRVQAPGDASREATRLASIFGVDGPAQDVNGDATNWTVTDPSGASLNYQATGAIANWWFSTSTSAVTSSIVGPMADATSPSPSSSATGAVPSKASVARDVQSYLSRMHYDYTLANPSFSSDSTTSSSPGAPDATIDEEIVNYDVVVDGVTTDQSAQFVIDSSNHLVSASGPAFDITTTRDYPLQSPVTGVAVLNAEQIARFSAPNGGPATPAAGQGVSGGSPGPSDATPSATTTTIAAPPLISVALNDAALHLTAYQLNDGSTWLIPVYNYTGTASNADGNSYAGTWSTIAVDPAYVHLDRTTRGVINY